MFADVVVVGGKQFWIYITKRRLKNNGFVHQGVSFA